MKIFFKLIALFLFLTGTGLSAYAKHPEQNPMVFGKNRLSRFFVWSMPWMVNL